MAKTIRVSDVCHLSLKRWAVELGCTVGSLVEGYASRLGASSPPRVETVGAPAVMVATSAPVLPVPVEPLTMDRLAELRGKAYAGPFSKAAQMGKQ